MKLLPKQLDVINEWCYNARKLGYSKRDVKKKIRGYPRLVRKRILRTFNDLEYIERQNKWYGDLKGGYRRMVTKPKSWKAEEEEDEEPEVEEDEEMEDLDSEEGEERRPAGRPAGRRNTPAVYQRPEPVVKGGKDWLIRSIPASFECIDTSNGEVVLRAGSYEELMLKLQVMSTQYAVESAKNTR